MNDVPRRYAEQFAEAEAALHKMEEAIKVTRELIRTASELLNDIKRERGPKNGKPKCEQT